MENKNSFLIVYIMLGICAFSLILTGLFLPMALNKLFHYVMPKMTAIIFQSAFIISGILDIWLIFHAKKKLS